ncbi:MAG TPA: hypothetical protein PKE15_09660 [Ottowia sp.]|nr:hypothetical protein [Ottowia sp.]
MTERAPKPYTAPDGKTRQARGPSDQAAAIASAGQNIADALRSLPSADSWEDLRLTIKHHGQGIDELAEAVAGAGNTQSEALSEYLAPAVDSLADAIRTGFALLAQAIQQRAA